MNKLLVMVLFLLLIGTYIFAQDSFSTIPNGFGKIILGISMEDAKKAISADGNFNYRGDQDLSILKRPNESLIECRGYDFIDRAFFQFKEDQLYSITILFNFELIDHYSLFTTLSKKYGPPNSLSPEQSLWETEENSLVLERPLQIKYLDKKIFQGIIGESDISQSYSELSRVQFLDQF
ncbi:MAG: hypothetical protein DRP58_04075 [Spirochaetes bacterium]|nr:MAG: hypothetical protein DRP58_04075 [Spirochaetota bacterium]